MRHPRAIVTALIAVMTLVALVALVASTWFGSTGEEEEDEQPDTAVPAPVITQAPERPRVQEDDPTPALPCGVSRVSLTITEAEKECLFKLAASATGDEHRFVTRRLMQALVAEKDHEGFERLRPHMPEYLGPLDPYYRTYRTVVEHVPGRDLLLQTVRNYGDHEASRTGDGVPQSAQIANAALGGIGCAQVDDEFWCPR